MKFYTKFFLTISFTLCSLGLVHAQESINASGGEATGSEGTVSYSVGQVFYSTFSDQGNGSISEGVQQNLEIETLGVEDSNLEVSMSMYPNPTAGQLTLHIGDYTSEKMIYQVFDLQGRQVMQGQISDQKTNINMADLAPSTYLVYVLDQDKNTNQTFKIIKK